jgi:hypothetical protein
MEVTMDATTQAPIACAGCGAALADDQRYCLHCGLAQGGPRVAFRELIAPAVATPAAVGGQPPEPVMPGISSAPAPVPAPPPRDWTPLVALGGLGTLALVLVVGVLIGRSGTPGGPAAPQVITVAGGSAPAAAAPVADTTVADDWPSARTGFTVELGTLPKAGTTAAQVAAATAAAAAKGASDVGVLDGDAHGAPEPGSWVVYSGSFDTRKQASRALAKLRGDNPDAAVLKVGGAAGGSGGGGGGAVDPADAAAGAQAVQDLNGSSGDDYQRKSAKLPDTVALPGKPPPKDDKAPGGGSGAETIG